MKQRVAYSSKEQRRDQRRAVSIEASLDGRRIEIVDLSLSGFGGGAVDLQETESVDLQEGQYAVLEFRGNDDQHVSLNIEIRRVFEETGEFGAVFHDISDSDFNAIERLMFPRRGNSKN